jgi:hypothetical protein
MSTRGEKSLAVRAKQQLSICCETLCEKDVVQEYIDQLERKLALLEKTETILRHSSAEKLQGVYFICGEGGEKDDMGLPDFISVCPAYGLDGMAMYKKHTDYSAPGW